MHQGRPYQYADEYYATGCQFWPGFVPQAMQFWGDPRNGYPWNHMPYPTRILSDPAQYVPDRTQVWWDCWWFTTGFNGNFRVSIELLNLFGKDYAVWKAVALDFPHVVDEAWLFYPHPQYVCNAVAQRWWATRDPRIPADGPYLNYTPWRY